MREVFGFITAEGYAQRIDRLLGLLNKPQLRACVATACAGNGQVRNRFKPRHSDDIHATANRKFPGLLFLFARRQQFVGMAKLAFASAHWIATRTCDAYVGGSIWCAKTFKRCERGLSFRAT